MMFRKVLPACLLTLGFSYYAIVHSRSYKAYNDTHYEHCPVQKQDQLLQAYEEKIFEGVHLIDERINRLIHLR